MYICILTLAYLFDKSFALGLVEDEVWWANPFTQVSPAEKIGDQDGLSQAVVEAFKLDHVLSVPELVEDSSFDPQPVSTMLDVTGRVNFTLAIEVTVTLERCNLSTK